MERSGFFNANLIGEVYDRVYLAEDFADYFASFIKNGIFYNDGYEDSLKVIANSPADMSVTVKPGHGWINGYWYENNDNLALDVSIADGALSRIDIVVLRLDFTTRSMYCAVVEGTPSTNPVAPEPARTAEIYELQLAQVFVGAGVTTITSNNITDTRSSAELCGYVQCPVANLNDFSDPPLFVEAITPIRATLPRATLSVTYQNNYVSDIAFNHANPETLSTELVFPEQGGSSLYRPVLVKGIAPKNPSNFVYSAPRIKTSYSEDPYRHPPAQWYDDEFEVSVDVCATSFQLLYPGDSPLPPYNVGCDVAVLFVRRDVDIYDGFLAAYSGTSWLVD